MNLRSWIYLILFLFSFFISLFFNYDKINVPYFGGIYKSVWIDTTYFENNDLKLIDVDNSSLNTLKIDENHYLYKITSYKKIKNINIKNPEKIKKIILYIGNKAQFDDFQNIDNSKNLLSKTSIIFLSFFYNFELYLFSYIFLFLFLNNFKGRINYHNCFWIILFLSFLLRLTQLNSIPFWDDEIYVLKITSNYSPLIELFQDEGNPPLYFILFKIYRTIVQNPYFYRFSSVITGCVFCVIFYFYVKKLQNKKTALIAMIFSGFSIALIYLSQEIRCYMLLGLLAILSSYFLFKKHKTGYLISSIALLYTHYYGVFYFIYNFLFSSVYFKKKKRKDFILINIGTALFYLPCLIYKFRNLSSDFNSWINIPQLPNYIHTIKTFCGYSIIFLIFLVVLLFVYKKSSKRKKLFISYNFAAILFVFIFAVVFSYLVKPIFMYRYFYIVYPSYIALCAVLSREIKMNIIIFLFFIAQGILGYQNLYCNHNLYLDFIKNDLDKKKANYIFYTDTIEGYREFLINNTKPIYVQINTGLNTIDPLKYGAQKPCICYVLNLYLDEKTFSEAKEIQLYKTPLGIFSRIEY